MKGLLKTLIGKLTGSSKKDTLHTHSTWISQEIEFKVLDEKNSKKISSSSALNSTRDNHISTNTNMNTTTNNTSNSNSTSENMTSHASSQSFPSKNSEGYQSVLNNSELPLTRKKQVFNLDNLDDLANQLTHQVFMIKERHSTYFNFELLLNQWDMNMSFLSHLNQELIKNESTFDALIAEPNGFLKTKTIVEKLILSLYNQHYPAVIKPV